jgi:hypothetical protein
MRISNEALFKVVSTRFGLRIVENSIENPHFIFCSSFQHLRLGSINMRKRSYLAQVGMANKNGAIFWVDARLVRLC